MILKDKVLCGFWMDAIVFMRIELKPPEGTAYILLQEVKQISHIFRTNVSTRTYLSFKDIYIYTCVKPI